MRYRISEREWEQMALVFQLLGCVEAETRLADQWYRLQHGDPTWFAHYRDGIVEYILRLRRERGSNRAA